MEEFKTESKKDKHAEVIVPQKASKMTEYVDILVAEIKEAIEKDMQKPIL